MLDPQALYSQTPGAYHMGFGYSNIGGAQDAFGGTMFGRGTLGDGMALRARQGIGYAPMTLMAMAGLSNIGVGGSVIGAIGAGLTTMGAAPLMAAYALAGGLQRGIDTSVYAGQAMSNVFRDRDAGGRMGLGASRDAALQYARVFRDLSSSADMLTNDAELKSIMSKLTDMQLLTTSRSAADMTGRFKKMVETIRDMSIELGTTLDGVMPTFQRHLQMGFLGLDDIRKSARVARGVSGVGIGNTQEGVQAFQMSQAGAASAQGGSGRLAAIQAANTLGFVQYQMLNDQTLAARFAEAGLGVGQDAAGNFAMHLQETSSALMNTEFGKTLAAFLGEKEGGKYTGRIDAKQLALLRNTTRLDLARLAAERLGSDQKTLLSFEAQMRSGLATNIQSSMNPADSARALNAVLDAAGITDKNAQMLLLERLTGKQGKVLQLVQKFIADSTEKVVADYEKSLGQLQLRNTFAGEVASRYSVEAQLSRVSRRVESVFNPLLNTGAALGSALGRYGDNISDAWWQRGIWSAAYALIGGGLDSRHTGLAASAQQSDLYRQQLDEALNKKFGGTPEIEIQPTADPAIRDRVARSTLGNQEIIDLISNPLDEDRGMGLMARVAAITAGAALGAKGGFATGAAAGGALGLPTGPGAFATGGLGGIIGGIIGGVAGGGAALFLTAGTSARTRRKAHAKQARDEIIGRINRSGLESDQKNLRIAEANSAYERALYDISLQESAKDVISTQRDASDKLQEIIDGSDFGYFGNEVNVHDDEIESDFMQTLLSERRFDVLAKLGDKMATKAGDFARYGAMSDTDFKKRVSKEFGIDLGEQDLTGVRQLFRQIAENPNSARELGGIIKKQSERSLSAVARGQVQDIVALFGETAAGQALTAAGGPDFDAFDKAVRGGEEQLKTLLEPLPEANRVRVTAFIDTYLKQTAKTSREKFAAAAAATLSPLTDTAGQTLAANGSSGDVIAAVLQQTTETQLGLAETIRSLKLEVQQMSRTDKAATEEIVKALIDRINSRLDAQ